MPIKSGNHHDWLRKQYPDDHKVDQLTKFGMNISSPTALKLLQLIDVIFEWVPHFATHTNLQGRNMAEVSLPQWLDYDYVSEITRVMVWKSSQHETKFSMLFVPKTCDQKFIDSE